MNLTEQTGFIISAENIVSKKTGNRMILIEYTLKGNKQIQQKWIYSDDPKFKQLSENIKNLSGAPVKLTLEIV